MRCALKKFLNFFFKLNISSSNGFPRTTLSEHTHSAFRERFQCQSLSHARLLGNPWAIATLAPLPMQCWRVCQSLTQKSSRARDRTLVFCHCRQVLPLPQASQEDHLLCGVTPHTDLGVRVLLSTLGMGWEAGSEGLLST